MSPSLQSPRALCGLLLSLVAIATVRGGSLPPLTAERETAVELEIPGAAVDPFGNLIFCTSSKLYKYSPFGTEVWSRDLPLVAEALAAGSAGEIYLTGLVAGNGASDFAIVKYSGSGDLLWSRA